MDELGRSKKRDDPGNNRERPTANPRDGNHERQPDGGGDEPKLKIGHARLLPERFEVFGQ